MHGLTGSNEGLPGSATLETATSWTKRRRLAGSEAQVAEIQDLHSASGRSWYQLSSPVDVAVPSPELNIGSCHGFSKQATLLSDQRICIAQSQGHRYCYNLSTARTLVNLNIIRFISHSKRQAGLRTPPVQVGKPTPVQSLAHDFILPSASLEAGQACPAAARFFALSRDLRCALGPPCDISGVH